MCVKGLHTLISALLHTQTAGEQSVTDKVGSSLGQESEEGMGTLRPTQGQSPKPDPSFPVAEWVGQVLLTAPCQTGWQDRADARMGWLVPRETLSMQVSSLPLESQA